MRSKKIIFRVLILMQLALFAYYYVVGEHGFYVQQGLKKQIEQSQGEVQQLERDCITLENAITDWHLYSYCKEQFVRERLCYAYPTDEIYYR